MCSIEEEDKKRIIWPSTPVVQDLDNCINVILSENVCPKPIDSEEMIKQAVIIINKRVAEHTMVPPLIHSAVAKGGKSTFLHEVFHCLKNEKSACYLPIIIDIHEEERRINEAPINTVIRLIGLQLVVLPASMNPKDFSCDMKNLVQYIEERRGNRNVILLVDNLDKLGEPIDMDLSILLQQYFLDRKGYFLVATSEVPLNLDTVRSDNHKIIINHSGRGVQGVDHVPTCTDVQPFIDLGGSCTTVTSAVVTLWSGIPSLIYCHMQKREMPDQLFTKSSSSLALSSDLLVNFLRELMDGVKEQNVLNRYAICSKSQNMYWVRWPLIMICTILDKFEAVSHLRLMELVEMLHREHCTGRDWELIIQLALVLHCLRAQMLGTNGPFDIAVSVVGRPRVSRLLIPHSITDLNTAHTFIVKILNEDSRGRPLILFTPQCPTFPEYDVFVGCVAANGEMEIDGYQVKLTRDYPMNHKPEWMRRAVLLRGRTPGMGKELANKHWSYLDKEDTIRFLGYSLSTLYPRMWLNSPSPEEVSEMEQYDWMQ